MWKAKSGGGGGNSAVGECGFTLLYSPLQVRENERLFRAEPDKRMLFGQDHLQTQWRRKVNKMLEETPDAFRRPAREKASKQRPQRVAIRGKIRKEGVHAIVQQRLMEIFDTPMDAFVFLGVSMKRETSATARRVW